MPARTLPQEILDIVIAGFSDDRLALKTFALVNRSWLSTCRSFLFHSISLHPPKPTRAPFLRKQSTDCQRLHKLLFSSPAIAHYIRNLLLRDGIVGRQWMTEEPTLAPLLQSLTNVERFRLERMASLPIVWWELAPDLRDAFIHILSSPSLVELTIVGPEFDAPQDFIHLLQGFKSLRRLSVAHLRFWNEPLHLLGDLGSSASERQKCSLDVLVVGPRTSTTFIDCLLYPHSGIDVSAVRKLSIAISGDFRDFAKLLRSTPSIEVFEITLMNDIDLQAYWALPPCEQLDLSHLPHLHTLDFKIDVIQRQDDPLPWLNTLFATVGSINSLRHINIVYAIYLPAPYMDRSASTTIFEAWQEIDATLTGMNFNKLKQVRLDFMLENPIGFGVAPRFLKEVDIRSPALEANEMLVIDAFDTSR